MHTLVHTHHNIINTLRPHMATQQYGRDVQYQAVRPTCTQRGAINKNDGQHPSRYVEPRLDLPHLDAWSKYTLARKKYGI